MLVDFLPAFLPAKEENIAYIHHSGSEPGVMFLGGFMSDMQGSKALALDALCRSGNRQFTRMDYGGHGQSSGAFAEGTIGLWFSHALAVFDAVTTGKQILVGSSMGGWMMLLLALARPERVAGLVGLASAPDFTETLLWDAFSPEQKQEMTDNGRVMVSNCTPGEADYPITRRLIAEGREHLLLTRDRLDIRCPVHLLHGMEDVDVPWQTSLQLAQKLAREDVKLTLLKNGDHRLSTPENLELLQCAVAEMVELC